MSYLDLIQTLEDLDIEREFYDEHQGLHGAGARLPEPLKRVAYGLIGTRQNLGQVKDAFETALSSVGSGKVEVMRGCIMVSSPSWEEAKSSNSPMHMWKVISHR